jgi:tRNA(Ile)-lysidine synthase
MRMANFVVNFPNGHKLERRLAESWPVSEWRDTHVVLGVSGGPDSVAMLRAMATLKKENGGRGQLRIAHLNHGMRATAADADETWLRLLCEQLKLPLEIERIDVAALAAKQGDGWEAAARVARYDFLRSAAERIGARFVATAHTADDQVETVLHRILRGTGIDGLAGMPQSRPLSASVALVRPMLTLNRREVLDYLAAIKQDYRTDASNENTQWTRNRLRHELLPQLRERYNSQVDAALMRLAQQAGEAQQVIVELAAKLAEDCVVADFVRAQIDCSKLEGRPPIVIREVFKLAWRQARWPEQSMGFDEWRQLAALASGAGSQPLNLPGNIRARRDGRIVVLEPLAGKPDIS